MARPTRYTDEMYRLYRNKGYWDESTVSDLWDRNAREYPDGEAIADSCTSLTWGEANKWIDRLALGFLEMGFRKDELIVLQLPNSVELGLLRVACERAGLLCLPVLRIWHQRELEHVLAHVEAAGVVIPWKLRGFDHCEMIGALHPGLPKLRHVFVVGDAVPAGAFSIREMVAKPLEEKYPAGYLEKMKCRAEEFSLVAATSGTTGLPKFIESPLCSRLYMARLLVEKFEVTSRDVIGVLTPSTGGPNHVAYFCAPQVHARIVMLEHFSAREAFELMEKYRITFAGVVPAQLAMMLRDPARSKYDLTSLTCFYSGGAVLPPDLGREVEEQFHCSIVQVYGAMDSGGMTHHARADTQAVRLCTIGKPAAGNELKLVDDNGRECPGIEVGEMVAKGPTLVSGYYKDPAATAAVWDDDGWYRTGDLGKFDGQGNLIIVGRKKEMIIRGGQNIYPAEIENLLLTHPLVQQVALVKMPDPVMGEKACACVVPAEGGDFTFEAMVSFLRGKGVAPYKLPERLEIIASLPMVAEGQKVDKKFLEGEIAAKLQVEAVGQGL